MRERVSPLLKTLGETEDVTYLRAVAVAKIADLLQACGEFEEALRMRKEQELPAFESLARPQQRALTLAKIAELLDALGDGREALRVYAREDVLPVLQNYNLHEERTWVLERLVRSLDANQEPEEALRVLTEELLPSYQVLSDRRRHSLGLETIALDVHNHDVDASDARVQLRDSLRDARKLGLPEAEHFEALMGLRE